VLDWRWKSIVEGRLRERFLKRLSDRSYGLLGKSKVEMKKRDIKTMNWGQPLDEPNRRAGGANEGKEDKLRPKLGWWV
jgi:hypothetical protein